jgi:hypothetical protein
MSCCSNTFIQNVLADGVITNVAIDGTNLVITGTAPGFNGSVDITALQRNIYDIDGSLTGIRTVDGATFNLIFDDIGNFSITNSVQLDATVSGIVDFNAGTTASLTGGTGVTVDATTGALVLAAIAANVDIDSATSMTLDSVTTLAVTAGSTLTLAGDDVDIDATVGDLNLGAVGDILLASTNNRFNILTLQAFDDDTAAGVGSLVAGDLYQTTGSGASPLDAAGIVMVKQ